jgi:hypothetical protein
MPRECGIEALEGAGHWNMKVQGGTDEHRLIAALLHLPATGQKVTGVRTNRPSAAIDLPCLPA